MKKNLYVIVKILILFATMLIFSCQKDSIIKSKMIEPVFADEGIKPLDLGSMNVQTDKDGNVSLKEIEEIKSDTDSTNKAANEVLTRYKRVIVGVSGLCTLSFVLIFLITFIKLSSSATNPQKRAEMSKSIIYVFLGAAGFGSITLFLSIGFGLFKGINK